ncbi:MAG: iron-sulfur cluster assembly scaffold protein [Caldimicrobium sp.]
MAKYYGKRVLEEFLNPKNVGEIPDADLIFTEDNPICLADSPPSPCHLKLFLKILDNRITEAKFKLQGCVAAIAFLSLLTEKLKGLTLQEVMTLHREELLKDLGYGIPEDKLNCPIINLENLKKSLLKYISS